MTKTSHSVNKKAKIFAVVMLKWKYDGNLMLYQNLQPIPNVLLKFVVDCHPSVLRLSMSVFGHRLTGLEWTATFKNIRLSHNFEVLTFLFPKCTKAGHELFHSRIQLISFS